MLGGAASGKSSYGEQIVKQSGLQRVSLATAEALDDETRKKVAAHVEARGDGWLTVEEPLDIAPVLAARTADEVVLIDCLTFWLNNLMFAERDPETEAETLIAAVQACACPVVMVSNEVGGGIVPENALARRFRNAQGRLNQRIAAEADLVVTVMAGLPLALKGALPA